MIALVGYTNAGKSTLFNRLTGAAVGARDQLFATLDPTMRRLELPSGGQAILSDTVGFIADLPTDLVAAFRATLEEVTTADLVIHVRDVAHDESAAQRKDVLAILTSLGLEPLAGRGPAARVLEQARPAGRRGAGPDRAATAARTADVVAGSARSGEGIEDLLRELDRRLAAAARVVELELDAADGAAARLALPPRHGARALAERWPRAPAGGACSPSSTAASPAASRPIESSDRSLAPVLTGAAGIPICGAWL